jgi:hypothetical protein
MRFEVLTDVEIHIAVYWIMAWCVAWQVIYISEEQIASIFNVEILNVGQYLPL